VLSQLIQLWGLNIQTEVDAKKVRPTDREMNDNTIISATLCIVRIIHP